MFIAHLPAGYICASLGKKVVRTEHQNIVFWCLLAGSILPDLDMLYFYLIDNRQTNHHEYWTHLPAFWAAAYLIGIATSLGYRNYRMFAAITALIVGATLHLALDTPVGGIAWLYPANSELLYLLEVPATRSWWVMNFLLHWTFAIELTICLGALLHLGWAHKTLNQSSR